MSFSAPVAFILRDNLLIQNVLCRDEARPTVYREVTHRLYSISWWLLGGELYQCHGMPGNPIKWITVFTCWAQGVPGRNTFVPNGPFSLVLPVCSRWLRANDFPVHGDTRGLAITSARTDRTLDMAGCRSRKTMGLLDLGELMNELMSIAVIIHCGIFENKKWTCHNTPRTHMYVESKASQFSSWDKI